MLKAEGRILTTSLLMECLTSLKVPQMMPLYGSEVSLFMTSPKMLASVQYSCAEVKVFLLNLQSKSRVDKKHQ